MKQLGAFRRPRGRWNYERQAVEQQRVRRDRELHHAAGRRLGRRGNDSARSPSRPRDVRADRSPSCACPASARAQADAPVGSRQRPMPPAAVMRSPTIYCRPPMRAVDIIRAKRDGEALSREAIESFVRGVTDGSWEDYQSAGAARWRSCLKGMNAAGNRLADRRHGALGRSRHPRSHSRRQGRQAQHRRRRRQGVDRARAAGGVVRRGRAEDVGTRPRPHRRHARQAREHSRASASRCRSMNTSRSSARWAAA